MKKVIFIGNFIVPNGNAAGLRVWNISELFLKKGFQVVFVGFSKKGKPFEYQQVSINNRLIFTTQYPSKILHWFYFIKRFRLIKKIIESLSIGKTDLLYIYGSQSISIFNLLLLFYYKKKVSAVINDVTEWHTFHTNNLFMNIFKSFDTLFQIYFVNRFYTGLVVISDFFYKFYSKKNKKVILLPPLFPKVLNLHNYKENKNIVISYFGSPFRKNNKPVNSKQMKDRVDLIVEYFLKHLENDVSSNLILNIYGMVQEEFIYSFPKLKSVINHQEKIFFHGFVENNTAREKISNSNFTILLRNNNINSKAGFPTKVAESISLGTPVILNDFGDIKNYVENGKNGFFVELNTLSFFYTFKMINNLSFEKLGELKLNCKNDSKFIIDSYVCTFNEFIEKIT